jgi:hypothetical protein
MNHVKRTTVMIEMKETRKRRRGNLRERSNQIVIRSIKIKKNEVEAVSCDEKN